MKKILLAASMLAALPLAGCNTPNDRTTGGALLGGVTGAAIGGLATGRGSGALVGGALGAATGAVIGANTSGREDRRRCTRVAYDRYGDQYCVRWVRY
jgi:outer membrane lipoprotein SlyB